MKEIIVQPHFEDGDPTRAWDVDGKYAITSDGLFVSLFEYEKRSDGLLKPKELFNFIFIAIDEYRTVSGLSHYIETLKKMSAWELLTERYNISEDTFYVNRSKDYRASYEEDIQTPKFGE